MDCIRWLVVLRTVVDRAGRIKGGNGKNPTPYIVYVHEQIRDST